MGVKNTGLPFSHSEYETRIERTRNAMAGEGLDALLVFHQENMFYLTGYDQIGYWVYQVLIVPQARSGLTAIVRRTNELVVRQSPFISDVRAWVDDTVIDPVQMTIDALREHNLLYGKRIGIERKSHALLPIYYDLLSQRLSREQLVDASDLIAEIRLIKSPAEIEYLRRAGGIMDRGVRAGFSVLHPSARECDVHAAVVHAMYDAGGGPPAVAPPIASGPNTITQTLGAATERVVQRGEPFLLEVGAQYMRYHAVCMRMAFLGEPPPRVQAMHDAIVEGTDRGLEAVKPRVPTSEVARRVLGTFEKRGFSRRGQQVGYGIGLGYPPTWVENLSIKETDQHLLAQGMAFILYGILLDAGAKMALAFGDPILVTETGYERLTTLPRELRVIE